VVVIAVGVAGARFLSNTNSSSAIPAPDPSSIISGKARDSFVTAGIGPCLKSQENDPDIKSLSLPKATREKYCSYYMNALADTTTNGDLTSVPKNGSFSPAMQKKIDDANAICIDKLRRSLLGG
jgi:hypothetical protein